MKILIVSHGILNNNSGLGRVHLELKQEYEKLGHIVDKIDYSDLYPKGQNGFQKIFDPFFTKKLYNFLKLNAFKYDVIDANFENIIYTKKSFNFNGLLFVRSHGIRPLYDKAFQLEALKKNFTKTKTIRGAIGIIYRKLQKKFTLNDFYSSLHQADIVHCLNQSEYDFFINYGINKEKLIFIPNGYPNAYLNTLNTIGKSRTGIINSISFISSWSLHKGVKDWREISALLIKVTKLDEILILGTHFDFEYIKRDFDEAVHSVLKVIPIYDPGNLPNLIKQVKVGVFPSYMEGFGFAVLEQLAMGIPVIAYNVPGVADFMNQIDTSFLVEPGNIQELVKRTKFILEMNKEDYEKLSAKCIKVSKKYSLENIAVLFLNTYQESLKKIDGRN